MISIAITGGIGSGKTYVARLFEQRGIPIYNADHEARRLMNTDESIRESLVALLGESVYQGGRLDKSILAAYLFASPEHVRKINSIVHPVVKEDFCQWLSRNCDKEVAGIESAILFEAGFQDTVDCVVMVSAPEELRLVRAMRRDGSSEQQIRARMAAQMSEEQKVALSDYVILNDETVSLEPQISKVLQNLKKRKI